MKRHLNFRSGMVAGSIILAAGVLIDTYVFLRWMKEIFQQSGNFFIFDMVRPVIYSIFLIVSGVQILYFTLIFMLFNKSDERL